jgi:uncharacterized protein YbgA (DUF1722 family)/uncharacterized protein YbbK (DUF523 family)
MRATAKPETPMNSASADDIRIGISSCLLGQEVRFDGGHKHDRFLTGTVARFVQFVPTCPEVDLGLGIPRESIRLVRRDAAIGLTAAKSGRDLTDAMNRYARERVRALGKLDLCGYILKKDSPSCGMERVRVHEPNGAVSKNGRGLFAAALMEAYPLLPVEEEGRLGDPRLRDNFFVRVFAYRRLRDLLHTKWTTGDLVRFHTAEKLLLLSHDPPAYRELGRLVAAAKGRARAELADEYSALFMTGLAKLATTRKHCNVLQHIQGYFRRTGSDLDRDEIARAIEEFRRELVPLVVPITLLRHFVQRYDVSYLRGQTYLEPHPRELMLRNHV